MMKVGRELKRESSRESARESSWGLVKLGIKLNSGQVCWACWREQGMLNLTMLMRNVISCQNFMNFLRQQDEMQQKVQTIFFVDKKLSFQRIKCLIMPPISTPAPGYILQTQKNREVNEKIGLSFTGKIFYKSTFASGMRVLLRPLGPQRWCK